MVNVVLDGDIVPKEVKVPLPMESKILLSERDTTAKSETQVMVEIDQRVGELERIVGSSSTTLDEVGSVTLSS